ncbi:insulinase family protein [Acidobacteria bacterium AH-259-D05]|nr:insulinase family protein [Acidobacteria bacterium AH-259-D05]
MRKKRLALAKWVLGVPLLLCFAGLSMAQKHYKDLKYPKLRNIQVPKVEQVSLANGMKLFVLEDHELPLVNLSARIRVGSIYEPPEKVGLAAITGTVMRTGGTITRSGDEIDEELENIAASVETRIGLDSGSASMSVLKNDVDTGLAVLADILMNPAFPEEKIQLAKLQRRSGISRRNDSANRIASREFRKLIYGPDSVYARHTEYATIDNITRDDLVALHREFFYPNNVMLAVWGDFDTSQMVRKIEQVFQAWEMRDVELPSVPEVNYQFRQTVNLIQKEDVNQTNIFMGHIGGLRNDPDYFALILMNRILGTGFTSRLFKEVRSRQGLAYSVFGYFSAEYDHAGMFYIGCQTKSETTIQAIRAMMAEVTKMTQSEVTAEELELARESFLNAFVFNFDSTGEIVRRLMTYAYYGYPLDFLEKAKENVEKVTETDILRVAKKHLRPDKMQILAVGRSQDFGESISVLGPVNQISVAIPGS